MLFVQGHTFSTLPPSSCLDLCFLNCSEAHRLRRHRDFFVGGTRVEMVVHAVHMTDNKERDETHATVELENLRQMLMVLWSGEVKAVGHDTLTVTLTLRHETCVGFELCRNFVHGRIVFCKSDQEQQVSRAMGASPPQRTCDTSQPRASRGS